MIVKVEIKMTSTAVPYYGEVSLFVDHELHETSLREPHRRQVVAGYKAKNLTVRKQMTIRRKTRHFKPYHTPHLDRKVRHIYPRGNAFYRVAYLSYSTKNDNNES
jgi:hypothetical protein